MVEIYRNSLEEAGCFKEEYPAIIKAGMATVRTNAPEKMKALMIATELTVFASNLRKPIMFEGATIPVNIISILIADSGIGKDSSMKSIRKALEPAYTKIDKYREIHAKAKAVEDAEEDGKKPTEWRKYYSRPRDLFSGIGTIEGQMKHLANLEAGKLGAGYIQVSELGSELQNNPDISNNLVALAVGFDSGFIPAKTVKSDEHQVDPIKNLPFSGLLFGAPYNIIFDDKVKTKVKEEMSTKLARRAYVSFSQEPPLRRVFKTIDEMHAVVKEENDKADTATDQLETWLTSLVDATTQEPLKVSEDVHKLFDNYKEYNGWISDTMNKQHPMSILSRQHLQWKALKFAAALAILNNDTTIESSHYVDAVNFTEIFSDDLGAFEIELDKEPYELCADYMKATASNGYFNMSIHQLRKMGFVKGGGLAKNKMLELVDLIKSYDDVNKYQYSEGYIHYYEGIEENYERDELA